MHFQKNIKKKKGKHILTGYGHASDAHHSATLSSAVPRCTLNILPHENSGPRRNQGHGDGAAAHRALYHMPAVFFFPPIPTRAAKNVTCDVSGRERDTDSELPTTWRIQKMIRVVAHRAAFPVVLLDKRILAPSAAGVCWSVAVAVLAHRSVQKILDVLAVDVVGLAGQGADEAYAPVVRSKQRHNVGALVAEELRSSECAPARSCVLTYPWMRCFGPSSRSARQLKQSCSLPVKSITVLTCSMGGASMPWPHARVSRGRSGQLVY